MFAVARATVCTGREVGNRLLAIAGKALARPDVVVGVSLQATARTSKEVDISGRRTVGRLRPRLSPEWTVALVASALSVAAYAYYTNRGLALAYNDAVSHMMIARRVVAGRTPGIAQLGTTWLPFNHVLMLPFVWIDALYRSGFAGAFPSMCAYVVGSLYLYRMGKLAFASSAAGWLAALAFMLNPNVLYMQSTPMSELDLLALAILAVYYTLQWAHTLQPADLVKAAVSVAAGTLVRYDAWALGAALAVIVLFIAWRRRGRTFAESNIILFSILGFAGCAGWLIYNQVIFGNALAFYDGPNSAKAQQARIARHAGLPTLHNPVLSLHVYAQATLDNLWLPLAVGAILGFITWGLRDRMALNNLPLYALLVPFAFNWLALVLGISVLETPEIPFNGLATYFNVRYGMMMIPAMAMFFASLAYHRRVLITASLALLVAFAVTGTFMATPYVLEDPLQGVVHTPWYEYAGNWLHNHYHGGSILGSYSSLAPTIFDANEPDSDFITDSNGFQFKDALAHPERWTAWIVMSHDDSADPVWSALGNREDWRRYYVLRKTFGPVQMYQRIDTLIQSPADTATPTVTTSHVNHVNHVNMMPGIIR